MLPRGQSVAERGLVTLEDSVAEGVAIPSVHPPVAAAAVIWFAIQVKSAVKTLMALDHIAHPQLRPVVGRGIAIQENLAVATVWLARPRVISVVAME